MRILHVTDLHISDLNAQGENLRQRFYREFIDSLVVKIHDTFAEPTIDFIICTGDFVDMGKTANFNHAQVIIGYLTHKLNLNESKVGLCIGNHDIILEHDAKGRPDLARESFNSFASMFSFGKEIYSDQRAKLFYNEEVYFLSLDSTLYNNGQNRPGKLEEGEIDIIANDLVYDKVDPSKLLIIASHYPMVSFPRAQYVTEEPEWVEKHLWKDAFYLVERIFKTRQSSRTLWLFGDGHIPDFMSYNEQHHFIMSGMIGGDYTKPYFKNQKGETEAFNKTNEVKIIEYSDGELTPTIHTFSYKSTGFYNSPNNGTWEVNSSPIRLNNQKIKPISIEPKLENLSLQSNENKIVVIAESIQREIIERIKNEQLYSLSRFVTSKTDASLGWISINRLFQNNKLLAGCVDKSIHWMKNDLKLDLERDKVAFIGVDFWGAIIASHISVRTGIKNFCIAARGNGKHNTLYETTENVNTEIQKIKHLSNIILFTDVISTGNTVKRTYEQIKLLVEPTLTVAWHAVSIISDIKQPRSNSLANFANVGTFCGDVRIPIIKQDDLPDEEILPPKLDFR